MGASQSGIIDRTSSSINSFEPAEVWTEEAEDSTSDTGSFVPRPGYLNLDSDRASTCETNSIKSDVPTDVTTAAVHAPRRPRSFSESSSTSSPKNTLKVVNAPVKDDFCIDLDPTVQRLNQIPEAFTILENRRKISLFRSYLPYTPGLTRPLDTRPLARIGTSYSTYIKKHSSEVSATQQDISKSVRNVNGSVDKLLKSFTRRQKLFAVHASKLDQVGAISKSVIKCQDQLKEVLRMTEILNGMLPLEDRLEPFSWAEAVESSLDDSTNLQVHEQVPESVSLPSHSQPM